MNQVIRRALSALFPVLLYLSSPGTEADATPVDLTVMSQNLYVGADPTSILMSPDPATIAAAFASVVANNFPARAGAIASEAASSGGPLLIGLQEASIISGPTGTLDYTQILLGQLAARGLAYTIAGIHTGLHFAVGGFSATDREVVLARAGVPGFTFTGSDRTFANNVTLSTPLGSISLNRGYVLVNATLDGVPFQFVSTHLDEFQTPLQPLQANEILAELGMTVEPKLVVGDFNADPTKLTYAEMLAAGFTDTAAAAGAVGPTCCQAADLNNPVSELKNRYDYVFELGFPSLDSAFLVGNKVFEDIRPLWPSDHAGVIATVDVPEPSTGALFISAILLLGISRLRAHG